MYTLKDVFPEPKKEPKRNFIRENMIQQKSVEERGSANPRQADPICRDSNQKLRKKVDPDKIRKGDVAEFLKRKEAKQNKINKTEKSKNVPVVVESHLKDTASQTEETDYGSNHQASGDQFMRSPTYLKRLDKMRCGDFNEQSKPKDPFIPPTYQRGVVPKYLRERRQEIEPPLQHVTTNVAVCPPGHVELPDAERKDTLRMLRSSFAELVGELNKMPVRTDTLRMRNRKIELEKQLSKLEEGIKVFSQPKVSGRLTAHQLSEMQKSFDVLGILTHE